MPYLKRFSLKSIRASLIAYLVILATIPLGVVFYATNSLVNDEFEKKTLSEVELVREARASEVQLWLENSQIALKTILTDPTQNQRMVSLLSADGAVLASSRPTTVRNLNSFLGDQLAELTAFSELFLYNAEGEISVSTTSASLGNFVNDAPFFMPSNQGIANIHAPYYDSIDQAVQLIVTVPVIDIEGRQVGVLAGRLDVNELAEILHNPVGLGDTGESYLVAADGRFFLTAGRFDDDGNVNFGYKSPAIDAAIDGETSKKIYENYRQNEVVGAYQWLPQLQSALVVEIDTDEAFAASRQISRLIFLISVGAILGAVGVGAFFAIQLTRPIGELTKVATEVADGDLTKRVTLTSQNEIGQLGNAFNQMTTRLVENIRELRFAKTQAQEATRLKSEFLAVMSHELRTPLNAIIGFTGIMLMSNKLDSINTHQAKRIQANSERLLTLINDILDISRIEAGRLDIAPAPMSIRSLVDRLETQMGVLAENKGLSFKTSIDPSVPHMVKADQDALTKIITNLLSNAVKFTVTGGVSLALEYTDNTVQIEVQDSGIGIPAHMHEVIFEPFRQVDSSSKRAYGGTGLGLAIVHSLCVAMQGSIRVESTMGKGSTFIVSLPLEVVEDSLEYALPQTI